MDRQHQTEETSRQNIKCNIFLTVIAKTSGQYSNRQASRQTGKWTDHIDCLTDRCQTCAYLRIRHTQTHARKQSLSLYFSHTHTHTLAPPICTKPSLYTTPLHTTPHHALTCNVIIDSIKCLDLVTRQNGQVGELRHSANRLHVHSAHYLSPQHSRLGKTLANNTAAKIAWLWASFSSAYKAPERL